MKAGYTSYIVKHINIGTKVKVNISENRPTEIVCGFKITRFIDEATGEKIHSIHLILDGGGSAGGGAWSLDMIEVME